MGDERPAIQSMSDSACRHQLRAKLLKTRLHGQSWTASHRRVAERLMCDFAIDGRRGRRELLPVVCVYGFHEHSLESTGLVLAGAGTFIVALFISAYWERDIRWLHFFQSWMYVAAIVLLLKGNRWGLFIGTGAALFWNYINLFVVSFFSNGLTQAHLFIQTGHLTRPELISLFPYRPGLAI